MRKKSIIFLLIFCLGVNLKPFAQVIDSVSPYRSIVKEFYDDLLRKKSVSIADCDKLFTSISLEYDEYLFLQNCHKKGESECIKLAQERYMRPSSYKSLLFLEFRKRKSLLTNGRADQIDNLIKNLKMRSQGVAELRFSDGVILFTFSNPNFEKLYLTDVFLTNGASIFNYVEGTQEKRYYK